MSKIYFFISILLFFWFYSNIVLSQTNEPQKNGDLILQNLAGNSKKTISNLIDLKRLIMPANISIPYHSKILDFLWKVKNNSYWHSLIGNSLQKGSKYECLFKKILSNNNVLPQLYYVALIESGFNPKARSPAGAYGFWQITSQTAKNLGLEINSWIDERADPERSTIAAAQLLSQLYNQFGSWELVLASYNMGHFGLGKTLQKNNTNDYWQLLEYENGLPWETSNYVSRVLGMMIVGNNVEEFDFNNLSFDEPLDFCYVSTKGSETLQNISKNLQIPLENIKELNPQLKRDKIPPENKQYYLRIPKINPALCEINLLSDLNVESKLNLYPFVNSNKQSDTIIAIIPDTFCFYPSKARLYYMVQQGDNLDKVSRQFNVSVSDLISWNIITPSKYLTPGIVLQIFTDQKNSTINGILPQEKITSVIAGSEQHYAFLAKANHYKRIIYEVKQGETLKQIAKRHNLSVNSLCRINRISPSLVLEKGTKLIIYER